MEPIIAPVDKELLQEELSERLLLRLTNRQNNEIYVFNGDDCPNTMREVGRLREEAFRVGGGGSGKSCDIDEYDLGENAYQQLVVWSPDHKAIIGGYRFINGSDVVNCPIGTDALATSHMFNYSEKFVKEILPVTLELGRSFVSLGFQSTALKTLSIYALDNLWDGLGALTVVHPNIKYFFGKVTMYANYNRRCRNLILHFMEIYFNDKDELVTPKYPLPTELSEADKAIFTGDNLTADYQRLKKEVRAIGINIPPLFNAYISLSPDLIKLGTAINEEFGDVEETGILINIDQILEEKKHRHISTFKPHNHGNAL